MAEDRDQSQFSPALDGAVRSALSGLRTPLSGDLTYDTPAAATLELREAARAFSPAPASEAMDIDAIKQATGGLGAVVDLIAQIRSLDGDARLELSDELKLLEQCLMSAERGKPFAMPNIGEIAGRISAARAETSTKNPERAAFENYIEVQKRVNAAYDDLEKLGLVRTDEQKKARQELEKAVLEAEKTGDKEAVIKAMEKLLRYDQEILEEWKKKYPHLKNEIEEAEKRIIDPQKNGVTSYKESSPARSESEVDLNQLSKKMHAALDKETALEAKSAQNLVLNPKDVGANSIAGPSATPIDSSKLKDKGDSLTSAF